MNESEFKAAWDKLAGQKSGGVAQSNNPLSGGMGGTRQGVAHLRPDQRYISFDIATGPDLAGYITCGAIRDDRFTRAEIDDARTAATAAERARIFAALEECRPTSQAYSRRDWAIEERGKRDLWAKIMKALGVAECSD
jgi:hypothetical protein